MSEVLKYLYLCRISRLNTVPYSDLRKAAVIVVKTVMGDSYYSDAESFLISFWRNCMYFFMLLHNLCPTSFTLSLEVPVQVSFIFI